MKTGDFAVGTGTIAFSLGIIVSALGFPEPTTSGTPGPAVFPTASAVFGVVLGALLVRRAWVASAHREAVGGSGPARLRTKWIGLVAGAMVYLALMPWVGFITSSAVFTAFAMWRLGYRHKARALALGFIAAFVIFGVFFGLMNVPLPQGLVG